MADVLIVREASSATDTARQLEALGHRPILFPLEEVVALTSPPPEEPFDGFVVTSAQGVPAIARRFPGDERPSFAVGAASGRVLEKAGFRTVLAADGNATTLAALIELSLADRGSGRTLVYAAGRNRSGSLEAAMDGRSIDLLIWEVYDVVRTTPDDAVIDDLLQANMPEAVLLLSRAQAEAFSETLMPKMKRRGTLPRFLCLSARIADALPANVRANAEISAEPRLTSLFERL